MFAKIFDVEHGQCSLIADSNGAVALIDCGHNTTRNWRPSNYLPQVGVQVIHKLVITNFDEDHVTDLKDLRKRIQIDVLVKNPTLKSDDLKRMKQHGIGSGISELSNMLGQYTAPPPSDPFSEISFSFYHNEFPTEFVDENNLSLVTFVKHPKCTICFPGDLERQGWSQLLKSNAFVREMSAVNVLVASHHGRENGCSQDLFDVTSWRPDIVVISDAGKQFSTQETVDWYRQRTVGVPWEDGSLRRVLTTRKDGSIELHTTESGYVITTGT